ncbi:hypothetical protein FOA43_003505 [Brettanomyces nanus]|uniref:Uncharacterized protein n=1 Tax=Eeniella nana TaxID=13502 RepID=A0A875S8X4_EENNA|nr:uncharacterized protein FOA43_003505 [Brettanomyces nanus]QPG76119.1 hypothetical protein FOA43_003505 [Brettanomyces nanus]
MNIPDQSIQQLRPTVIYCLDHELLPSAEFTAERLLAQDSENPDSIFLYALTIYKEHRFKAAYNAASRCCTTHVGCSYIFAKSCLQLEQEPDGISSLTKTMPLWSQITSQEVKQYEPDNIACYMLLAKLYYVVGDTTRSALNYGLVLKLNPYIFEAFEQLCKLGARIKVNSIYKSSNPMGDLPGELFHTSRVSNDVKNSLRSSRSSVGDTTNSMTALAGLTRKIQATPALGYMEGKNMPEPKANLFKTPIAKSKMATHVLESVTSPDDKQSSNSSSYVPTNFAITPRTTHVTHSILEAPSGRYASDTMPRKKGRSAASSITSRLLNHSLSTLSGTVGGNNAASGVSTISSAASQSLNTSSYGHTSPIGTRDTASGIKRVIASTFGGSGVDSRGSSATIVTGSTGKNYGTDQYASDDRVDSILKNINDDYLVSVYSKMAKGYRAMCSYDCFKAIRIFNSLPENERNTPWVLAKLGRLHFEIVNYEGAEKYFVKLRKMDRTRVDDMEYYSTLLWHLHKEIDLSFLSHELYEINQQAPQTWIAIGNLYSLKREPDEAIKCFQKAIKLDKKFVYAYTLQGHEYLANDAIENAMECFRHAIALDKRHYNAFYGIGMVYLKLGDFRKAEFHFRKASEINPVNVILVCCVGMVLEKLDKREEALRQYVFASKLQPLSMLALFKKAQALFSLKRYELALKDFQKLEDMAPDEASVHFLLGKLYKFYGRKNDAIKQFTVALNLDPKGSHLIKEALENLQTWN